MSAFHVSITAETGRACVPFLRRNLRRAYELLASEARANRSGRGLALREVSLALSGDQRMSDLHEQFMKLRGPTDVLTFPMDQDRRGRVTSGEVVICVPEARRQARERGIPVKSELLHYAIHGMLHLLGYDDRTARGFRVMHRTEDELMRALGLGAVFAPVSWHGSSTRASSSKNRGRGLRTRAGGVKR